MLQGSVYASDFKYVSVLDIAGFGIYQVCEYAGVLKYASASKYVKVLDIPQFYICQGDTEF